MAGMQGKGNDHAFHSVEVMINPTKLLSSSRGLDFADARTFLRRRFANVPAIRLPELFGFCHRDQRLLGSGSSGARSPS